MKAVLFLSFFIILKTCLSQPVPSYKNFECINETRVSGLFQFKRKFLKETEFFPIKTTLNFRKNFQLLTVNQSTTENNFETKYQFDCEKSDSMNIIICEPTDRNNAYNIKFSLESLRYKKTLITDYWLNGKGNEIDYVHIAHGYCYDID